MIGHIQGEVIFSDGLEVILLTNSGIGYQVYCHQVLAEGNAASLFISHVIREASEELYGFKTLRDKKMFELLISVKGVGPKSAFALLGALGVDQIIEAVNFENKKTLTKAPGIGTKAASQIILDLANKISKVKMYSNRAKGIKVVLPTENPIQLMPVDSQSEMFEMDDVSEVKSNIDFHKIMDDTLMACKELGFKEEKVLTVAQTIMAQNSISKAEQLVHLVLKEM